MKKLLIILLALVLVVVPVYANDSVSFNLYQDCIDYGFDYGVARFDWNGTEFIQTHGPNTIELIGNSTNASWSSEESVDAVISNEMCTAQVLFGGTSGEINKAGEDEIKHVVFCMDEEEEPEEVCENTDVMLVIDRSSSMAGDKITKAKSAAKGFIDLLKLDGNGDYAGEVSFSTSSNLDEPLTDISLNIKSAIDSLSAGGLTCITCGLNDAQDELDANGRDDISKVIVLLTDGYPTAEDTNNDALIAATNAKGNGSIIFTIGIGDADPQLLEDIASTPDYFSYGTEDDLEDIYAQIAGEICRGVDPEEVPEFGTIAAGIALVGAVAGFLILRRPKK